MTSHARRLCDPPPTSLSAANYRALAQSSADAALTDPHGPTADRHATIALAHALCAISAALEPNPLSREEKSE